MSPLIHSLSLCFLVTVTARAQQTPKPTFDVASVRPSNADSAAHSSVPLDAGNVYDTVSPGDARTAADGYFIATHQGLWRYISFAYKLSGTQELALRFNMFSGAPKSGAPSWVTGFFTASPEYFDISARAPADPSIDDLRTMMQTLLADRFGLVIHYTSADTPVFALTLSKTGVAGPNLQPHPVTVTACDTPEPGLPPVCGIIARVPSSGPGQHYGGRAVPLSLFATSIPTMTGLAAMPRPVIDSTGLTGLYDFTLTWQHDAASGDDAVPDNAANFRDALKQQLGLDLKPSHAPIDFLIVDHVERPSEN